MLLLDRMHGTTLVLYHKNCCDGKMSAAVLTHFLDTLNAQYKVLPITYSYDEDLIPDLGCFTHVVFADCFNLEYFEQIKSSSKCAITIFDHHESILSFLLEESGAEYTQDGYYFGHKNRIMLYFSDEMSTSKLLYSVLFPREDIPDIILDVDALDTRLYTRKNANFVLNFIVNEAYVYDDKKVINELKTAVFKDPKHKKYNSILREGKSLNGALELLYKSLARSAFITNYTFNGYSVRSAVILGNVSFIFSDVADTIFRDSTDVDLVVNLSYISNADVLLNMRSRRGTGWALRVAKDLGGGGHPDASGAKISRENMHVSFDFCQPLDKAIN